MGRVAGRLKGGTGAGERSCRGVTNVVGPPLDWATLGAMRRLRLLMVCWVSLVTLGLGACGGGARVASPNEPADLESLERELALREAELRAQLPSPGALANVDAPTASGEAAPQEAAPPRPEPAPVAPAPAPSRDDADEHDRAEKKNEAESVASTPCELMCRALGSMRRSATGICSLTSPSDERCVSAQQRVETAARQVTGAGCSCQP